MSIVKIPQRIRNTFDTTANRLNGDKEGLEALKEIEDYLEFIFEVLRKMEELLLEQAKILRK